MITDVHKDKLSELPVPYFINLHKTAMYVFAHGTPFFIKRHFVFQADFVEKWIEKYPGKEGADAVAEAFAGKRATRRVNLLSTLIQIKWISSSAKSWVMVATLAIPVAVFILPLQFLLSTVSSGWHVLKKGVRSVPPLITAVVVVFVTSDAWRILGTGFTVRFFVLVGVFLLASLFFLIRYKDYWEEDIYVPEDEANKLLEGIRGQRNFDWLIERGAEVTPMIKPTGRRGQIAVYISYLALSAFSIIGAALFVSGGLILVGLILINADETKNLAQSVNIYWTPSVKSTGPWAML